MKKVYNIFIPAKGFRAMTVWPFIFVRLEEKRRYGDVDDRHETIHGCQQKEMLVIAAVVLIILLLLGCGWWSLLAIPLFFWWYVIEYVIKLCYYHNATTAYKNISFEREAFGHQSDIVYLDNRKHFAWIKFLHIRY